MAKTKKSQPAAPPTPAVDGEEVEAPVQNEEAEKRPDQYEMKRIVKSKKDPKTGKHLYLINWAGYGNDQNTWEPEENIFDKAFLAKYHDNLEKRKKKKRGVGRRRSGKSPNKKSSKPEIPEEEEEGYDPARWVNGSIPRIPTPERRTDAEPTEGQFDIIDDDEVDMAGHASQSAPPRPKKPKVKKPKLPPSCLKNLEQEVTTSESDEEDLEFYGRRNDNPNDRADYTLADNNDPNATVKIHVPANAEVNSNGNVDDLIAAGESAEGISDYPGASSSHTTVPEPEPTTSFYLYNNDVTVTTVTSDNVSLNVYEI